MSSTIRIKRSSVSGNPSTLAAGELAYSALVDNGSNGGDRLYIGMGTETAGNAANHVVIGGKFFTDRLSQTAGTLTASAAIVVGADKKIDDLYVDNLQLNGNTIFSTDTNGNITLSPNGTGKTVLINPYVGDTLTPLSEYIYDTVGGAITAGTGITITNSDAGNTSTVSITNSGVTAGSYGSASAIPVLTVNAQGQITAASTAAVASTLSIAGDTGTDSVALLTDTLTFVGGTGLTSTVTNNTVTLDIDATVATLSGTQTLTNKTINLTSNTLVATSAQLAAAVSDETGSGSLVFATSPTLVTPTLGAALATSVTATSGNITIAAAAGNNSVSLAPTGTGTVDVSSKRITNVAEPTQATDAATKNYVDAVKTGLTVKDAVRVATTANLAVTYSNGTSGVGATLTNAGTQAALTIDSIVLVVGDRVLVKDQTAALQNGIYTVTNVGSASANWILTRAPDFDQSPNGEISGGDFVFVQEGTVGSDNGYVVTTNGAITVGTTSIDWVQFSGAGSVIAGAGLTKTGNTIDVVGTANRITVAADAIDIASTYVGQTSITTLGTIATGTWQGTIVSPTYGGTGVNNGTKTITLGGNLTTAGAFTTTLTATANTSITLPTTGTLATLAGTEALTNKTVNGLTITSTTGTLTIASGGTLATSGAFSTTLTSTAATNVTLPTTGTLATLAGTEALSNKTITASSFAGSVAATTLSASGAVTLTSVTDATALGTAAVVLSGGLSVAKTMYIGTNITGSGPTTSTLDGFNIDGGTY